MEKEIFKRLITKQETYKTSAVDSWKGTWQFLKMNSFFENITSEKPVEIAVLYMNLIVGMEQK